MRDTRQIDLLFQSVLRRFFLIPARQPALGTVTFAQMRVLWILEAKESAALNELARVVGVSNSTAAELVDKLVRGGFVRREQSTVDRREVVLTLRPKGRGILAEFAKRRQERFQKLRRVVGPRDMERMAGALETLSAILGKWHGEEP